MNGSKFQELETEIRSGREFAVPKFLDAWLKRWKRLYINGSWSDGASGETFCTVNPATEEELSEICLAKRADVDRAVQSARTVFEAGTWASMPLRDRAQRIKRIGDLILEHRAPLAILESLDTGKPIRESFDGDIPRAARNFHFFAEFALEQTTKLFQAENGVHMAFREPLGVVALITPWNLPLYLETWKIAPALLMGNSVILKPSELTPLTAAYFTEIMEQADLPAGVFNLIQGLGEKSTGEFLTAHTGVDAISFTGETSTGRAIMRAAAEGPTRVSFELGGKGAAVVFDDCDLDKAITTTLRASYRNQGEICLACPRVIIHEKVYDQFKETFVAKAQALKVGNPLDWSTEMGALISKPHYEKVMGYISTLEEPAKLVTGAARPKGLDRGYFLAPTVIEGAPQDSRLTQEEIFGPVALLYKFSTDEEAIQSVNGVPYGLSASVWTGHRDRALHVGQKIRVGMVWVNDWFVRELRTPFGGQKRSGVGREGGEHSLDFYSEWKSLYVQGAKE